jgi:hypothetical protein
MKGIEPTNLLKEKDIVYPIKLTTIDELNEKLDRPINNPNAKKQKLNM